MAPLPREERLAIIRELTDSKLWEVVSIAQGKIRKTECRIIAVAFADRAGVPRDRVFTLGEASKLHGRFGGVVSPPKSTPVRTKRARKAVVDDDDDDDDGHDNNDGGVPPKKSPFAGAAAAPVLPPHPLPTSVAASAAAQPPLPPPAATAATAAPASVAAQPPLDDWGRIMAMNKEALALLRWASKNGVALSEKHAVVLGSGSCRGCDRPVSECCERFPLAFLENSDTAQLPRECTPENTMVVCADCRKRMQRKVVIEFL
jgi:hypothetical protein